MTKAERHRRAMKIFDAACDMPPPEREAYLTRECGDDVSLRRDLDSLLKHDSQTHLAIEAMDSGKGVEWLANDLRSERSQPLGADDTTMPERIGAYRIIRVIGRGGMGVVYEAEQENPKRRVALKMVRPGLIDMQLRSRLQREANVLGRLQHPGIAQVHEAGMVDVGGDSVPFFAMEYIVGDRITTYADKHDLSVRQRLALMARVCDAVHHAHEMDVIHRDLKPANILIAVSAPDSGRFDSKTEGSGGSTTPEVSGQPKVLDFGIARMTNSDIQTSTIQTAVGQIIGTLSYMSPEQVAGNSQQLDAHCDIYALGVVLFELLTGRQPLDLSGASVAEAARIIRDEEPLTASSVNRTLRGDVETIIAKALDKDPQQRYESASQFAADIRRYLDDEPIVARPASAIYNLRKFARRNRGLVAGLAAAFVVLVLGTVGTALGLASALDAKKKLEGTVSALADSNRSLQESNTNLRAVTEFQSSQLTDIDVAKMGLGIWDDLMQTVADDRRAELELQFSGANFVDIARTTLDRILFSRAIDAIEAQFAEQPLLEATMLQDLATTMRELGLYQSASAPQQRALEIRRRELGDEHHDTVLSINQAGSLALERSEYELADSLFREAWETNRRLLGENDKATLSAAGNVGIILRRQGKYEDAEEMLRKVMDDLMELAGPNDSETHDAMDALANVLNARGEYEEAEGLFRDVVARRREVFGDQDPETAVSIASLSTVLENRAAYEESISLAREVLALRERVLGTDHPDTLRAMTELGGRLVRQGKHDQAEPILRKALAKRRRLLGDDHFDTITSVDHLASVLEETGRFAEAEALFRESFERRKRTLGDDHPATLRALGNLGHIINEQGRPEEVEPIYRETLAGLRRVYGSDHPHTLTSLGNLAVLLTTLGRSEEAAPLSRESLEGRRRLLGDDHPSTLNANYNMGSLLSDLGKLDEAEIYCRQALEGYRRVGGDDHIGTLYSLSLLGSVLWRQGKAADATVYLQEAVERRRRINGDDHPQTVVIVDILAQALEDQGRWSDAEKWRVLLLDIARRSEPIDEMHVASCLIGVGKNLLGQSKHADAEPLLRDGVSACERAATPDDWRCWSVRSALGEAIAADPNRYVEAEQLLLECYHALNTQREDIPDGDRMLGEARSRIAALYQAWGKSDEAAKWLGENPLTADP